MSLSVVFVDIKKRKKKEKKTHRRVYRVAAQLKIIKHAFFINFQGEDSVYIFCSIVTYSIFNIVDGRMPQPILGGPYFQTEHHHHHHKHPQVISAKAQNPSLSTYY